MTSANSKKVPIFLAIFFGGIFFVFQSGALFLAIFYMLEQKPVLNAEFWS
jgi:acyl-CoA synthetase (NDP forming)